MRKLKARQSGIHSSEMRSVLPLGDCSPDALLSIAAQDRRLKVSQGRYIYLTAWGNPRRETISKAVSAVLENTSKPLALEEIVALVEHRVGRKCEKPTIYGVLRALEAESDQVTREWSLNLSAIDDDDDGETADTNSSHVL